MKLRVTRMSGFGHAPPIEFEKPTVLLGSGAHCDVRFDPTWEQKVTREHAMLEWDGAQWILHDKGGGILVEGRRLAPAAPIGGTTELQLGQGGPRVRIEVVGAPVIGSQKSETPAMTAGATRSHIPSVQVPADESSRRPSRARIPSMLVIIPVLLVVAASISAIFLARQKRDEKPMTAAALDPLPPQIESPGTQPVVPPPVPPASLSKPAETTAAGDEPPPLPAIAQKYSAELRAALDQIRKDATTQALYRFFRETSTRSPYLRSLLENRATWYEGVTPWLAKRLLRESYDLPGIYVGEVFGPLYTLPNTPASPPALIAVLGPALFNPLNFPAGAQIASLSARPRSFSVPEKLKSALAERFRAFSGRDDADTESATAWGVFVGITDFEEVNDLFGCRNDAAAIAKVLMTQGMLDRDHVRLLTDTQKEGRDYASKANVIGALRETLEGAGPKDVIFLGFSTHGSFDRKQKDSLLVMADSRTGAEESGDGSKTMLYGSELQTLLAATKARNIVIMMDACHSGGMAALGANQFAGSLSNFKPQKNVNRTFLPESFYEMLGSARGHTVIRACRADQTTPDLAYLGHGLLITVLIAGLTGDADNNKDGLVTLSELRIYVTSAIPKISRIAAELGDDLEENGGPLEPTFTSGSFGEAGDLPLTVVLNEENQP